MKEESKIECARLEALFDYGILDTPPEPSFDAITQLAASICQTPIALISLVDDYRQWFKSAGGLDARSTPRDQAFCAHAIQGCDIMEVPDAMLDHRFSENPLVTGEPHIRFYAGQPLITDEGFRLGTLCVIDRVPRELLSSQRQQLKQLSLLVMSLLNAHRFSLKNHIGEIVEGSFNEIFLINVNDLTIEHANKAAINALNRQGENIRQLKFSDICIDFEKRIQPVLKELSGNRETLVIEGTLQPKNKQAFPAEMRIQTVQENESIAYFIVIANDISERKLAEQILRDSQDFYRALLRDFPLLVWHAREEGKCNYFNETWRYFTGRNLTEDIHVGWAHDIHPVDRDECIRVLDSAFEKRQAFQIEYRRKRHDGQYRSMNDWGKPYFDIQGNFAGFIGAQIDITNQKETQRDLQQHRATLAQMGRFNLLSEMATNLAHELNQPLTAISNYCDAALDLVQSLSIENEPLKKAMSRASQQSKHAGAIIRHLREFLRRGGESERQQVSINSLIETTFDLMSLDIKQKKVFVEVDLAPALPEIFVDVIQVEQVIINLVRNALDALTQNDCDNRKLFVQSRLKDGGHAIEVLVQDNGPGVPSHLRDRIFEHFNTTKPDGLGLGLSISCSIIESHEGTIGLDDTYQSGARFCFCLPSY